MLSLESRRWRVHQLVASPFPRVAIFILRCPMSIVAATRAQLVVSELGSLRPLGACLQLAREVGGFVPVYIVEAERSFVRKTVGHMI